MISPASRRQRQFLRGQRSRAERLADLSAAGEDVLRRAGRRLVRQGQGGKPVVG